MKKLALFLGLFLALVSCRGTGSEADPLSHSGSGALVESGAEGADARGKMYYAKCRKLHGQGREWTSHLVKFRRDAQALAREHNQTNPGHSAKVYSQMTREEE